MRIDNTIVIPHPDDHAGRILISRTKLEDLVCRQGGFYDALAFADAKQGRAVPYGFVLRGLVKHYLELRDKEDAKV